MSKSREGRGSALPRRVKADGVSRTLAAPQSSAHSSRFGSLGGSRKVKDTRPLHDKSFQQKTVKSLCEFLGEHECPLAVTPRELQSPSTKLYLQIFEFMSRLVDPDYILPSSKVDEEVPRLFRDLGYPFTLSKSAMRTVGTLHTWPHILGATLWLMEYIKMTKAVADSVELFSPMQLESREEEIACMERKVEQKHYAFQEAARKLKLMPPTAENAGGRDIDIDVAAVLHEGPEHLQQHFLSVVKPMGKVKTQIQSLNSQVVLKTMSLEQVKTLIADRERNLRKLEFDLRVLEDNLAQEREREALEREERRHRQEIEEIALKCSEKQKHMDDGVQEATKEYKKLEADVKENIARMRTQRRAHFKLPEDVTILVYNHYTFVEGQVSYTCLHLLLILLILHVAHRPRRPSSPPST